MYNISFNILSQLLLPPRLRQGRMIAWVRLLLSGVEYVYNSFLALLNVIDDRLRYNGQVAYLQKAISDKVIACSITDNDDPAWQLNIYNVADDSSDLVYFFNDADSGNPLFISMWLFNTLEYQFEADYYVMISAPVDYYMIKIGEIITQYNNAGKRYKIKQQD
jgi:hypothetical protein